jgi:hypothetical protein
VLAVCATPGQLDYFTALVFQQYGEQSTLCKGQRCFCHNVIDMRSQKFAMGPWSYGEGACHCGNPNFPKRAAIASTM